MRIYPRVELIGGWVVEPRVPKLTSMSVFKPSLSFKSPCLIFSLPPSVGEISLFAHISLFSVEKNKHVLYRWNRIKYINSNPINSQIEISFFAPKIFHPKSPRFFRISSTAPPDSWLSNTTASDRSSPRAPHILGSEGRNRAVVPSGYVKIAIENGH